MTKKKSSEISADENLLKMPFHTGTCKQAGNNLLTS